MEFRFPDKPVTASPEVINSFEKSGNWLVQDKYDGWRIQIYIEPSGIRLLSRVGNQLETRIVISNEIKSELSTLVQNVQELDCFKNISAGSVIDGEYIGPRGSHKPMIYLFDWLAINGTWISNTPFIERWNMVKTIEPFLKKNIQLAHTINTGFIARFEELKNKWIANNRGLDLCEGIVAKRKSGTLEMNLSNCAKSRHMFRCKFREIREERY